MLKKPIIEVKDLTVRYGDRTILENVNFEIYKGEIFVIVGGSGCGKSTLLRQIIGLEKPYQGQIIIGGEDFTESEGNARLEILRKFGILFQFSGLLASMTVAENIALVLKRYTQLDNRQITRMIDMKLSLVGLKGYEDFIPAEISGGMKKRAGIARALTLDPEILCFDEPSSGLDPISAASLDNLIINLNTALKSTMIVVSHDLASIMKISQRIVMLDKNAKGLIAVGTPEEMLNHKNKDVYNFFNRISS
jgi:phospholipid/cholesterol/gamma-HCH transport system ATP-binding protein